MNKGLKQTKESQLKASLIFLFFVFSLPQISYSQFSSTKKVKKVVITGTRTSKSISEAPVKTEVLSEKLIESYHYKSVDEVLPHLPSVGVQANSLRPGSFPVIQGLGEDHVLVLIDGIPQSQNSTFGFDLSQVSTSGVKKIEVVKGGASALYGSQAMGGVINIITKSPSNNLEYDIDLESGRYPENEIQNNSDIPNDLSFSLSKKISHFAYRIYGSQRNRAAVNRNVESISQDLSKSLKLDGGGLLSFDGYSKDRYILNYRIFSEDISSIYGTPSPTQIIEAVKTSTNSVSQNISFRFEKDFSTTHKLSAFLSREEVKDKRVLADRLSNDFIDGNKKSTQLSHRLELQWDFSAFKKHFFTTGLVWNSSRLNQKNFVSSSSSQSTSSTELDSKSYESVQFFVQDDIILAKSEWVPGVRFHYDRSFGLNLSPKLSYRYNTKIFGEKAALRTSVGSGYKVPSLKERFYFLDHRSIANYIVTGNQDLKPEQSLSYQLGLDIYSKKENSFYINGFYNYVSDLINPKEAPSGSSLLLYQYENLNSVDIYGLEFNAHLNLLAWLSGESSITYTKTKVRETGKGVPLRPLWYSRTSFNFGKSSSKYQLSSIFTFTGKQFTNPENTSKSPNFATLDLRLNYKFNKVMSLYFGVENIFNSMRPAAQDNATFNNDLRSGGGRYIYVGIKARNS